MVSKVKVRTNFNALQYLFWGRRSKRRRSSRKTLKTFFFCLCLGTSFLIIMVLSHTRQQNRLKESDEIIIDFRNNYLQSSNNESFLVDTGRCRIPDFDVWDDGIRRFVGPPTKFKCSDTYMNLTYVKKDAVIINESALKSIGYTLNQITCCYNMIERVEQAKNAYDMEADSLYRYTEDCLQMEKITRPKSSFIKVFCKVKGFFPGFFTYTNFHMLARFSDEPTAVNISRKLSWWADCLAGQGNLKFDKLCDRFRDYGRPPNILVLGVDSTSRGNFHRFMHKTKDLLENVIKPVEMLGYNKVGENTFPNIVPLMSSFFAGELIKECFANHSVAQDDCPYIWKKFSELNYLTGHLEDAPRIATFNYLKTGFLKPPVDIYPRPFMLAAYEEKGGGEDLIDCIGYQRPEEMILNYIVDLAELADSKKIPYFLTTWLTDLTHYDMNNLQLGDAIMAETLTKLYEKGLLENTILYLMSDHGYRFLEVRTTTAGWFEDKLPTLWIKLPPAVARVHWSWVDALQYNARNLVTPFDIHESFKQILNAYWRFNENIFVSTHNRGVSPFTKIPMRSCQEAEIPTEYCACIPPTACRFNSTFIKSAAETVVQSINNNLPKECTPLKVATITACGMINESKMVKGDTYGGGGEIGSSEVVVVALQTKPGNFLFEALVKYNKTTGHFTGVSKLSRMNKKTTSSACLVKKDSWMELLCYCDLSFFEKIVSNIITY